MKRTINMKIGIGICVFVLILTVCGSLYAGSLGKNIKNSDKWSSGNGFAIKVVMTIEDGARSDPSSIFTSNGIDQFICPICDKIHNNRDNHWSGLTETNLNKADICIYIKGNTKFYYHTENKNQFMSREAGLILEAKCK